VLDERHECPADVSASEESDPDRWSFVRHDRQGYASDPEADVAGPSFGSSDTVIDRCA
jgi:hypothetical protein